MNNKDLYEKLTSQHQQLYGDKGLENLDESMKNIQEQFKELQNLNIDLVQQQSQEDH